jgi:hypothetical protein
MNLKQIIHQLLKDKDNNFSLREVVTLVYVLMSIISWVAQQFFGANVPEFMFYAFISMIGAGTFGYSLERRSKSVKETLLQKVRSKNDQD